MINDILKIEKISEYEDEIKELKGITKYSIQKIIKLLIINY